MTDSGQRPSAAADREAAAHDRRRLIVFGLVSLLAVVALLIAACQASTLRAQDERRDQRNAVRAAAPTILADVFSYTPETVAADSRRARSLVSDEFAAANAPALTDQRVGAARWRVHAVGIGESGDDWADAVAVVSVADPRTRGASTDRVLGVRFVHRSGRWLLDSVEAIR